MRRWQVMKQFWRKPARALPAQLYGALMKRWHQQWRPQNERSLIKAINIMLEVQPAVDAREGEKRQKHDDLVARLEKMGVKTDALKKRFSD